MQRYQIPDLSMDFISFGVVIVIVSGQLSQDGQSVGGFGCQGKPRPSTDPLVVHADVSSPLHEACSGRSSDKKGCPVCLVGV